MAKAMDLNGCGFGRTRSSFGPDLNFCERIGYDVLAKVPVIPCNVRTHAYRSDRIERLDRGNEVAKGQALWACT